MIHTGMMTIILTLANFMHFCILLYYLLRLNSIVPCIILESEPLFIDLLIFYLFRIFLNEANKCSQASGDMGSTMI